MRNHSPYISAFLVLLLLSGSLVSCKKLVTVDEPIDTITAEKMFKNEPQAEGALAGVYNSLIHGSQTGIQNMANTFLTCFGAGLANFSGGLSAGEFTTTSLDQASYALASNKITLMNSSYATAFWQSAYHVIYNANSVIEGIASSENSVMRDSVKLQYTAEAKFLRAFSYFYLVNFFGDVPLALTVDFNKTATMQRTPVSAVYDQILRDLEEAERNLPGHFGAGKELRVRVNKWGAKALMAKVHLFRGNYPQAAAKAAEVIAETGLFKLEPLQNVFLTNSKEAIFQLMQTNQDFQMGNATAEGSYFIPPDDPYANTAFLWLTTSLIDAFEPGDKRWEEWTDSTMQSNQGINLKVWYPAKYKTGTFNSVPGAPSNEFYMVFRLAEMYLIRAEARANGADGGYSKAIEDLNAIRVRTSLNALPLSLDEAAVKEAVAHEREIELFAEWGNRWMDLKRTGKASATLSAMPAKQPWEGDYQLLYPIPIAEIEANRSLMQNPGYIR